MASNNNQQTSLNESRMSEELLPYRFRTQANKKFLRSTLDQLISEGGLEHISGYIGRKYDSAYHLEDNYVSSPDVLRSFYQLEPAIIRKDNNGDVLSHIDYIDFINSINILCDAPVNERKTCYQEMLALEPHIDFDKIVNYRNYYWVPGFAPVVTINDNIESVIGKKTYFNGTVNLSNGMVVRMRNDLTVRYVVEGVNDNITLIPISDLTYNRYIAGGKSISKTSFGTSASMVTVGDDQFVYKDYITINRASQDLNAWSRTNRWIHRDTILNSNGTLDPSQRASRPIIEFNPNIKLYNSGTVMTAVTLFDSVHTDASALFSSNAVVTIDGRVVNDGDTIVFARDIHPATRNKIAVVNKVVGANGYDWTINYTSVHLDDGIIIKYGQEHGGVSFIFDGIQWVESQAKTSVNQYPYFDVVDAEGISYSNQVYYPASDFKGTTIFQYSPGDTYDEILGFDVKYKTVSGVGVLSFLSSFNLDAFNYFSAQTLNNVKISSGFLKNIKTDANIDCWVKCTNNKGQAIIQTYNSETPSASIELKMVEEPSNLLLSDLEVYLNGKFVDYAGMTLSNTDSGTFLFLPFVTTGDDIVVIYAYTNLAKRDGYFYTIPSNLEVNPYNDGVTEITMSDLISHTDTMKRALITPSIEDSDALLFQQPNLSSLGTRIVQHTSPMILPMLHLVGNDYNVVKAIETASKQYQSFKFRLISAMSNGVPDGSTAFQLDRIIEGIYPYSNTDSPYYYSTMVPTNASKIETKTAINSGTHQFILTSGFDYSDHFTTVMVYINDVLQIIDDDYHITENMISVYNVPANSIIKIAYYRSSVGFSIPPTPTKLGIAPRYIPTMIVDDTYLTPVNMIRGHDGSLMVAFGDYRDAVILELEKRIYNNCKVSYDKSVFDFDTKVAENKDRIDYQQMAEQSFLLWATGNGFKDYYLHYFYDKNNPFTYNYSSFFGVDNEKLPGFWRKIYQKYYGTDSPHIRPWESLGMTDKPANWDDIYGTAPYTSNNTVLWQEIARVRQFMMVGDVVSYIPVDQDGKLLNPLDIGLVLDFSIAETNKSFVFGDGAPYEDAWLKNSDFQFSMIKCLCVTNAAETFGLIFDRIRQIKTESGIVYTGQKTARLSCSDIVLPSAENITSGLINWIYDYAKQRNHNEAEYLSSVYSSVEVALTHRIGGYSIKDKTSIALENKSVQYRTTSYIPSENFQLFFNDGYPSRVVSYSGVMIEKADSGYAISGYDLANPHFVFHRAIESGNDRTIRIGGATESYIDWDTNKLLEKGTIVKYNNTYFRVLISHTTSQFDQKYYTRLSSLPLVGGTSVIMRNIFEDTKSYIGYGEILPDVQAVCDFLQGYAEYLTKIGFIFDYAESDTVYDWELSIKDFAFWTTNDWNEGTVLTISPAAKEIKFYSKDSVVDNLFSSEYGYHVRMENGQLINQSLVSVDRHNGEFTLTIDDDTVNIYSVKLFIRQKEHIIVIDNKTIFGDVVYDLSRGFRKSHLMISGYKMAGWNGSIDTAGMICDMGQWVEWTQWADYTNGDVVKYRNSYYIAENNIAGSEKFNETEWAILNEKPQQKLTPNFDFQVKSFEDMYDYDTDSIDSLKQDYARHLIGYQKRDYLRNLIPSEISQVKFYQGMIRDKGTVTSIDNMFDSTMNGGIKLYEEWAFRVGRYGSTGTNFQIDADLQPLANNAAIYNISNTTIHGTIPVDNLYKESGKSIPTTTSKTLFTRSAGYVNEADIKLKLDNMSDILDIDINSINIGDVLWILDDITWDVKIYTDFDIGVIAIHKNEIEFNTTINKNLNTGDIMVLKNNDKLYYAIITTISERKIGVNVVSGLDISKWKPSQLSISYFESARVKQGESYPHFAFYNREIMPRVWRDWLSETYNAPSVSSGGITQPYIFMKSLNDVDVYGIIKDSSGYGLAKRNTILNRPATGFGDLIGFDVSNTKIVYWSDTNLAILPNASVISQSSVITKTYTNISKVILTADSVYILHSHGSISVIYLSTNPVQEHYITQKIDSSSPIMMASTIAFGNGSLYFTSDNVIYRQDVYSSAIFSGKDEFGSDFADNLHFHDGYLYATIRNNNAGGLIAKITITGSIVQFIESSSGMLDFGARMSTSSDRLLVSYVDKTGTEEIIFSDDTTFDTHSCRFSDDVVQEKYTAIIDSSGNYIIDSIPTDCMCILRTNDVQYISYIKNGSKKRNLVTSWDVISGSNFVRKVNTSLIRNVFLYDNRTMNKLVQLDIIDTISGKIIGVAEQELSYKTSFDPATYNNGTDLVVVDPSCSWGEQYVGKLWWDTNSSPFVVPYHQDAVYSASVWNDTTKRVVSVSEWVKSSVKPSEWDKLSGTEKGLNNGISGKSLYGDTNYTLVKTYNQSGNEVNTYYFWVVNPTVVRISTNRSISAMDVAMMISKPHLSGIPYIQVVSSGVVSFVNAEKWLRMSNVSMCMDIGTTTKSLPVHSHYAIISEDDQTASIPTQVERKWFDSLIGFDENMKMVPDANLPVRLRYGVVNRPRQSMFVDNKQALKQFISNVNRFMASIPSADIFDLSTLEEHSTVPNTFTGKYDAEYEAFDDFLATTPPNHSNAILSVTVSDGRITDISINSGGRGYGKLYKLGDGRYVGPSVDILSNEPIRPARIMTVVDDDGSVISTIILSGGDGYNQGTRLIVRPYSVLVKYDSNVAGKWSIYTVDANNRRTRVETQSFNLPSYWEYTDWFAPGYSNLSRLYAEVNTHQELSKFLGKLGKLIRVENDYGNGWGVYLITDNGYSLVGKKSACIKFNDSLYLNENSGILYDVTLYDSTAIDAGPERELRVILNMLKEQMEEKGYRSEYLSWFFSSVRYAMTEQPTIDWAFKTSFIKVEYEAGELLQPPTQTSDTVGDVLSFIEEVKPYRTKIRDVLPVYRATDTVSTGMADFDIPFTSVNGVNSPMPYDIIDGIVSTEYDPSDVQSGTWFDTIGNPIYSVTTKFTTFGIPLGANINSMRVTITGGCRRQAVCSVTYTTTVRDTDQRIAPIITVVDEGDGYLSIPEAVLSIKYNLNGEILSRTYSCNVTMGKGLHIFHEENIYIDRVAHSPEITNIRRNEIFQGTQSSVILEFLANLDKSRVEVFDEDNMPIPPSQFSIVNNENTRKASVTVNSGNISRVNYDVSFVYLHAVDRISNYYTPAQNQLGNVIAQLISGVEYGNTVIDGGDDWEMITDIINGGSLTTTDTTDFTIDAGDLISPENIPNPEELVACGIYESVMFVNFSSATSNDFSTVTLVNGYGEQKSYNLGSYSTITSLGDDYITLNNAASYENPLDVMKAIPVLITGVNGGLHSSEILYYDHIQGTTLSRLIRGGDYTSIYDYKIGDRVYNLAIGLDEAGTVERTPIEVTKTTENGLFVYTIPSDFMAAVTDFSKIIVAYANDKRLYNSSYDYQANRISSIIRKSDISFVESRKISSQYDNIRFYIIKK